jgi:hypothetical protein
MYTKQEAAKQRQAFWTRFGQYMQPVLSAEGEKINWINYRTGLPDIYFRMEADQHRASIGIIFSHTDAQLQQQYFDLLLTQKKMLRDVLQEDWQWELLAPDEQGKLQSRMYTMAEDLNINRTEDWPGIISFFKPRIIALDMFWSTAKYAFEVLL